MRELLAARKKLHEQEKPEKVENAKRYIPKVIEKWVVKTTNGQCSEFGCYKPYNALHHEDPFSENHEHDPDKIKPVCKEHHELEHQSESFVDRLFRIMDMRRVTSQSSESITDWEDRCTDHSDHTNT